MHKDWTRKAWLASFLLLLTIVVLVVERLTGCSTQHSSPPPQVPTPTAPAPTPPAPPAPPSPTKPGCDTVTTFDKLQPILSLNCVGCHVGYDQLDTAKTKVDAYIAHIKKPLGDPDHMPAQRPSLPDVQIAVFDNWKKDGLRAANDCGTASPNPTPATAFLGFPDLEQRLSNDLSRISLSDQPNIRWLVAELEVNMGNVAGLALAKDAANKGVNSVSVARDPQPIVKIADGVWRINIDDLKINAAQWKAIEDASLLNLESFTQTGLNIKSITKSRLPWIPVQEFNDIVLRNASVYYNLTQAPATLNQLFQLKGVDFAGDLADQKALLVGFNGSSLSPAANRLMARFESNDGYMWLTFDTGPIVSAQQNLFANPLLAQAGGQANLKFAAGEQIFSLPNGLQGYFLADNNGLRLDQANEEVVHDFTSNPISPTIKNSISCHRCHNGGIIGATDKVRASLAQGNLNAADTQIALALYKPQTTVNGEMAEDNERFAKALQTLSLDPSKPDPIAQISDVFLGDLTLPQVAALLFQRPQDLTTCINTSPQGRQQASQLVAGGTISHDQLVPLIKQLQTDCRLFEDPLTQ